MWGKYLFLIMRVYIVSAILGVIYLYFILFSDLKNDPIS